MATSYDDEAIIGVQAQLASYGMTEAQILKTTDAILDYAAATGKDLPAAAEMMGKAFIGKTAALSKLGIVVDETKGRTERYGQVLDQITGRFGGSAAAAAQTYEGQMRQLQNAWGDAQEGLGKFLGELMGGEKPFSTLIEWARAIATFFAVDMVLALGEVRAKLLEVPRDRRRVAALLQGPDHRARKSSARSRNKSSCTT